MSTYCFLYCTLNCGRAARFVVFYFKVRFCLKICLITSKHTNLSFYRYQGAMVCVFSRNALIFSPLGPPRWPIISGRKQKRKKGKNPGYYCCWCTIRVRGLLARQYNSVRCYWIAKLDRSKTTISTSDLECVCVCVFLRLVSPRRSFPSDGR